MKITDKLLTDDLEQRYVLLNEKLYSREFIRDLYEKRIIYHPLVLRETLEKNLDREDFRINLYKFDKIDISWFNGWLEAVGYLNEEEKNRTGIRTLYIKL